MAYEGWPRDAIVVNAAEMTDAELRWMTDLRGREKQVDVPYLTLEALAREVLRLRWEVAILQMKLG